MASIIDRDIAFYEGQIEQETAHLRRCFPKDEKSHAARRDACRDVVAALRRYAAVSAPSLDVDVAPLPGGNDINGRLLTALEDLLRQTADPDPLHPAWRAARREAAAVYQEARAQGTVAPRLDVGTALADAARAEEAARRHQAASPDPGETAPGCRL